MGGRYLMMGNIVPGATTTIVPHDAVRSPKLLLGVLSYDRWVIPRALDWLRRRQSVYPFAALVADTFSLERINDAFQQADWSHGQGQVSRAIIRMDE